MRIYHAQGGDTLLETAEKMVAMANKTGKLVWACHNDIELWADPGDNPNSIVDSYCKESKRREEEQTKFPFGRRVVLWVYDGPEGTLPEVVKNMVKMAQDTERLVVTNFNGIRLRAEYCDTTKSIIEFYYKESERQNKAI